MDILLAFMRAIEKNELLTQFVLNLGIHNIETIGITRIPNTDSKSNLIENSWAVDTLINIS